MRKRLTLRTLVLLARLWAVHACGVSVVSCTAPLLDEGAAAAGGTTGENGPQVDGSGSGEGLGECSVSMTVTTWAAARASGTRPRHRCTAATVESDLGTGLASGWPRSLPPRASVATEIANGHVVSAAGLSGLPDQTYHFDWTGQRALGTRYAEALLNVWSPQ